MDNESVNSKGGAYAQAGVDISAGRQATALMKEAVTATYGPEVLAGLGAFGGLYDAACLKDMAAPVLVASTDGVGT
jgi:phosphoribosylformylglycinamidine cyclo-ligase